jgi:RNA polymerase sigma factor (sigma-70 family)
MDIIKDNWQYIQATAQSKAVEIAQHVKRIGDIEDFTQDLLLFLLKRAKRYRPDRGQPKTFINMILTFGQKDMIRRMFRNKRRVNYCTVSLEQGHAARIRNGDSFDGREIDEHIEALPDPDRVICRAYVLDRISIRKIAVITGRSETEIQETIRNAMRPIAARLGIRAAFRSGKVTEDGAAVTESAVTGRSRKVRREAGGRSVGPPGREGGKRLPGK